MIWYLLTIVVFLAAIKEFCFDGFMDGILYKFLGAMMAFLIGCFAFLVSSGLAALTGLAFDTHPVKISETQLVAIRDKDGLHGEFFLGTGSIQSDQYYFYYKQLPDGGMQPSKVHADQGVRVYEQSRKDAVLVTYEWQLNKPWAWYVALPVNDGGYSYDFYVPTGTVRRGFSM